MKAHLDGQIAEVEFWRAEMAKADEIIAQQAVEQESHPKRKRAKT